MDRAELRLPEPHSTKIPPLIGPSIAASLPNKKTQTLDAQSRIAERRGRGSRWGLGGVRRRIRALARWRTRRRRSGGGGAAPREVGEEGVSEELLGAVEPVGEMGAEAVEEEPATPSRTASSERERA
ncbi:hypothetical protein Scep_026506 [Stephania cephalantha]|uniref:Uncharacterized protein n=1 Tax=Stephania cephalantha TaxID=152367 RepID=A0AAP0HS44_9MAGN